MNRRAETIKLQGNVHYAKVATRLLTFLADNPTCSIETTATSCSTGVMFRAVVTCERGTFTGHSYCTARQLDKLKQFEKQETIAVGRALAFAGYLASGEIASLEEMHEHQLYAAPEPVTQPEVDNLKRDFATMHKGKTREQMQELFAAWVVDTIDEDIGDVGKFSSWSRDQLDLCQRQLAGELADAEA